MSKIAQRQNDYVRSVWRENMAGVDSSRFIFLDETRRCIRVYREFTRATRGYSALAVLTMDGIAGVSITRAPGVDARAFKDDLRAVLLPILKPDSIVVMD